MSLFLLSDIVAAFNVTMWSALEEMEKKKKMQSGTTQWFSQHITRL